MIKTVIIPTPSRIRNKMKYYDLKKIIRKYATKERGVIYSLIGSGLIMISMNSFPGKPISIALLIYNGIAYEVLEKWYEELSDDELKNILIQNKILFNEFPMGIYNEIY